MRTRADYKKRSNKRITRKTKNSKSKTSSRRKSASFYDYSSILNKFPSIPNKPFPKSKSKSKSKSGSACRCDNAKAIKFKKLKGIYKEIDNLNVKMDRLLKN